MRSKSTLRAQIPRKVPMSFFWKAITLVWGVYLADKAISAFSKKVDAEVDMLRAQRSALPSHWDVSQKEDREKEAFAIAESTLDATRASTQILRVLERRLMEQTEAQVAIKVAAEETAKQVSALHHHLGHQGGPQHEVRPLKAQVMAAVSAEVDRELAAPRSDAEVQAVLTEAAKVDQAVRVLFSAADAIIKEEAINALVPETIKVES